MLPPPAVPPPALPPQPIPGHQSIPDPHGMEKDEGRPPLTPMGWRGMKGDHPGPRYDKGRHQAGCWCCQRPRHALDILLFLLPRAAPGAPGAKHRAEGARSRLPAVSPPCPCPCPVFPVSSRGTVASLAAPQDLQGLPHGGDDHPVQLPGHKEGAQHRSPPPWHPPKIPPHRALTWARSRCGVAAGSVPRSRRRTALSGDRNCCSTLMVPLRLRTCAGTAGFAVPQFPQRGSAQPLGEGVQGHPTWWGAPAGTSTASPGSWRRLQPLTPHSSRSRRRRAGSR